MSGELHPFLTKKTGWYEPSELLSRPGFLKASATSEIESYDVSGDVLGYYHSIMYVLDDDGYAKPVDQLS
jgi:hypothetical protein